MGSRHNLILVWATAECEREHGSWELGAGCEVVLLGSWDGREVVLVGSLGSYM